MIASIGHTPRAAATDDATLIAHAADTALLAAGRWKVMAAATAGAAPVS